MKQMFIIPGNTLLVIAGLIFFGTIGFVIYGFIKGWDNVLKKDYAQVKEQLKKES